MTVKETVFWIHRTVGFDLVKPALHGAAAPAYLAPHRAMSGTIPLLIDCQLLSGDSAMSDEAPPLVYDGLDPEPEPKPTIEKVSEAVKDTARRVSSAIDAGRKPGMPLSILSNIAREAPLGSLLVAFLLGVLVGRRR
jgi:hypothetical protein